MGLVTTADVLTATGVVAAPGTTLYNQIDLLRKFMEQTVRNWLKWEIEANDGMGYGGWIEYYDGKNATDVTLRKPWVSKSHQVLLTQLGAYGTYNQGFSQATPLSLGQDYSLVYEMNGKCKSGMLRRLGNNLVMQGWWPSNQIFNRDAGGLAYSRGPLWPNGYGNIRVTYDWGFQPSTAFSTATWAAGVATFTFASAIVARPTDRFTVSDAVPATWNGEWTAASVSDDGTQVTARKASDPGALSTAGTADFIPLDIKAAVCQAVTIQRAYMLYGGRLSNESLGDYSYGLNFDTATQFGSVRQMLAPYRNMIEGIGLI